MSVNGGPGAAPARRGAPCHCAARGPVVFAVERWADREPRIGTAPRAARSALSSSPLPTPATDMGSVMNGRGLSDPTMPQGPCGLQRLAPVLERGARLGGRVLGKVE